MPFGIVPCLSMRFTSIFLFEDMQRKMIRATGISDKVLKIDQSFKDILAVLPHAQAREMEDDKVRCWLNQVKKMSYEMDDAFDEYCADVLKLKNEGIENPFYKKKKVCFFFLAPRYFSRINAVCHRTARVIKNVNQKLDAMIQEKNKLGFNLGESTENQTQITSSVVYQREIGNRFHNLSQIQKLCLLYVAIFPKDCMIDKNKLIKLWMAQGYLGLEQNIEMEAIGQNYFDYYARQSFFQDFEKDDDGNIVSCKICDGVYDFVQNLSKNEYLMVEFDHVKEPFKNSSGKEVFHVGLMLDRGTSFPEFIYSVKKLRSLLISTRDFIHHPLNKNVLSMILNELTCLRALDISGEFGQVNLIENIPEKIGELKHLRYLDLSYQKIEELPKSLCELYNLQTLNLKACAELKKLPDAIEKLLKLRHLMNEYTHSLNCIPKGIGELTCLQTLSEFVVSGDGETCSLECLKDLNNLRGKLSIRGLGNVTIDLGKGIKVLQNKRNLFSLQLRFDKCRVGERKNEDDKTLLLEVLQPPSNLEKLRIDFYRGNDFPSNWIMALTKLRELRLYFCKNCKHLSPLGKLPSLKSLCIEGMNSVKRVDDEFWGIDIDARSSSENLFSKLEYLQFSYMEEFEEWDYGIEEDEKHITIMPHLASLTINSCNKLKALPDSLLLRTTLVELNIFCSNVLEQRYFKGGNDWPKISHIPTIRINMAFAYRGPR